MGCEYVPMKADRQDSDAIGRSEDKILVEKEYDKSEISPSTAVVEVIALVEDVDPVGLSTAEGITLHDYIDADALDRLLTDDRIDDLSIIFSIDEYTVWMESDRITVTDTTSDSPE